MPKNLRNLKIKAGEKLKIIISLILILIISTSVFAADKSNFIKQLEKGKSQTIVCYGTSLTAGDVGWVYMMEKYLNKRYGRLVTVINSAQAAMWSGWGVENLDKRVIDKKPDTVIIEFAVNDAFLDYKTSKEDSRNNLNQMIDRIKRSNQRCEVIVMVTNPVFGVHLERRPDILQYYDGYRAVAKERKLKLIDTYDTWNSIYNTDKEAFETLVPDLIHPSTIGSKLVTFPAVMSVLYGYNVL